MAAGSEPPYLPIGTDVSAKYRGAFCEAKVKKIVKSVKCRVFLKETQSSLLITDEYITGPLQIGAAVQVKHPDTGRVMEATIKHMSDSSMYTVVFDDADERTLRRTQLCLKGDKHFMESETLDNLPLSNPEHFGTPVIARGKRGRSSLESGSNQDDSESSDVDEESPRKKYRGKNQELVGKPMFYESGDKKKTQMLPVLVVLPDAHPVELKTKDHLVVRSFRDGKFLSVARKELCNFTREAVLKNDDKSLKPAMERALLYMDNRELPSNWNKEELLGSDDEDDDDEETSDDEELNEERDRFVAQLYKFSDDRGTPINKGPSIGTKDLDLYKLFKVVQKYGGYNRVTNQIKWRLVYSKMQLPPSNTASTQIKNAYKKYLHAFEDFYRKLGSSMGTISRPSRSRNDSGRSIPSFRGKDTARTPDKTDSDRDKISEGTRSEVESDAESVTRLGTPKRPKSSRTKIDPKEKETKAAEVKDDKKNDKPEAKKDEKKETKKGEESPKKTGGKKSEEKKESKIEDKKEPKIDDKKEIKSLDMEKKFTKRKEDGSVRGKSDTEEEQKEFQKKVIRRRSTKSDDKADDTESVKKDKGEQIDKTVKENGDTEVNKETEEKPEKRIKKKKSLKSEDSDAESEVSSAPAPNTDNLPVGSKLRVKYGKGKNTREYEAKVLEVNVDSGPPQYLVHYQGWNNRHDEWVGRDRIMKVLERPDGTKVKKLTPKQSPKPGVVKVPKKKSMLDKAPASPSSVKSDSSISQGPSRSSNKVTKSASAASSPGAATPRPRPTRSNSIELMSEGLPAKRRKRKVSSVYDSVNGSDSEDSGKSDAETEVEAEKAEKSQTESPSKSISMPSIASEKPEDTPTELDSSLDLSPPKLMKQVDIGKDKQDTDEKPVTTVTVEEGPPVPVPAVTDTEIKEPILQKLEAQLHTVSPEKMETLVQENEKENKEKETKKKEPEKRGRKSVLKLDKLNESEAGQKTNTEKNVDKEESAPKQENKKVEQSPYDFKDDSDSENVNLKPQRTKPNIQVEVVQNSINDIANSDIMEDVKAIKASLESKKELAGLAPFVLEEKDTAKSDSEVERRGRKRKAPRDQQKEVNSSQPVVSVSNLSTSVSNSPERKPFITLAEKKQGFSPMVRKVIPLTIEKPETESAVSVITELTKEKIEQRDEFKKGPELLVVHKASPTKSDIVVGKKEELEDQDEATNDSLLTEETSGKEESGQGVKKKVRKKTKKKLEMEEQETLTIVKRVGRRPGRKSNKEKELEIANAAKDNAVDVDLRCEERIRSRSASPETSAGKSFIQESQGFVPRVETIDCRLSDSQGSDSFVLKRDKSEKQLVNKNNMYENTPPTTPEHDSDDASHQHGSNDQIKTAGKSSDEGGTKADTGQAAGSESPVGNASPSNHSTGSSGQAAGSEGSVDVPVFSGKRRRESEEPTPTKRRKRASRGKSTSSRTKIADSDSEDFTKGRSPQYTSESYQRSTNPANTSPRPPKYNFNLEEGKYLEGTARIAFLVEKIHEIRKIYMNLKSEVACIDRHRKKLRRKERERETAQNSSTVEVECS